LNTSPFHFDVSVVDTLLPLSQGATVYLSGDVVLPGLLLDKLERLRITHVCAVASTLNMLSRGRNLESRALNLVCIMTGAEVLNVPAIQTWLRAVPGVTIINGYGPTEATCVCVAHPITEIEAGRQAPYPIGFPLQGVDVQVCDDDGRPVQAGVVGEIVVGGGQLMREYLGRPEETRARWLELDGKRFYRTGDLGQKDHTGLLSFVGRVDQEVKLRGYRVHLNEVRQALLEQPGVDDAALHLVDHGLRGRDLAATVLSHELATPHSGSRILEQLRARLPEYMVPRYLLLTSVFPKLPSGKIDQRALDKAAQAHVARAGVDVCVLMEMP
jgi:acyl-coenzyme A synthetase/AMP-(fatty) acid ligase